MSNNPDETILHDMEEGEDSMTKYSNMILEFIKKDIFTNRQNITVEEIVTLTASLVDLSVSLLSKSKKEPLESSESAMIGRDVFKYMVAKLGFDIGQLSRKSASPYA